MVKSGKCYLRKHNGWMLSMNEETLEVSASKWETEKVFKAKSLKQAWFALYNMEKVKWEPVVSPSVYELKDKAKDWCYGGVDPKWNTPDSPYYDGEPVER